jgi:hypothetical protein
LLLERSWIQTHHPTALATANAPCKVPPNFVQCRWLLLLDRLCVGFESSDRYLHQIEAAAAKKVNVGLTLHCLSVMTRSPACSNA